jgi:HKD family nuclease
MQLLLNNYEDELRRLASNAVEIKVLIAFLTEGGLSWLSSDVAECADFIVGIDLGISSPTAMKSLQKQGATVMVFSEKGRLFHPKSLYIRSEDSETLIVGSNNLTTGGIASNHELAIEVVRNDASEPIFSDFLAYFDSLKVHACCGEVDDDFYDNYKQSSVSRKLTEQFAIQQPVPLHSSARQKFTLNDLRVTTLVDFLHLLAEEFPNVERQKGQTIKDHPLKKLNDEDFVPLFQDIVSTASSGRMVGYSKLTVAGNWYRIPNIVAVNEQKEPWEHTNSKGRLVLQVHFSDDFTRVYFSIVLQFNNNRSVTEAEMPSRVAQRYKKLLQHVEHLSLTAELDLPPFRHWNYKDEVLWGKPLITYSHPIESLPNDDSLCRQLEDLAKSANGMSAIG